MSGNGQRGNSQSNGGSRFDNSKTAMDVGGGIYGVLESTTASAGKWLGANGKYYSNYWGGNGATAIRAGVFKATRQYRFAGNAVLGLSAGIGVLETFNGYRMDGGHFGYNAQSATAQTVGGIGGSVGGAALGVQIGGFIGAWFGGVGAIPCAVVGGFFGGYFGGELGSGAGRSAVNLYSNR